MSSWFLLWYAGTLAFVTYITGQKGCIRLESGDARNAYNRLLTTDWLYVHERNEGMMWSLAFPADRLGKDINGFRMLKLWRERCTKTQHNIPMYKLDRVRSEWALFHFCRSWAHNRKVQRNVTKMCWRS